MNEDPIPEQQTGDRSDIEHHVIASTQRQAHSNFVEAARRLLSINAWKDISGPTSALFQLTDAHGNSIERVARTGDFIRINIPGPGPTTGDGYDWVHIESIDDNTNPAGQRETLSIRVRPAASPTNSEADIAHFFQDQATSTFMIERNDLTVKASVHGRNELPNKEVHRAADKIRNTVVAAAATSGVAAYQWSMLVQGIVRDL